MIINRVTAITDHTVLNRHLNINRNPFYTDIKNHAIDQ